MTLFSGHELATALATLAALLAVLTGGQLHPAAWAALAAVPLGAFLQARKQGLPTRLGGVLALAAVLFGVVFTMGNGLTSILLGAGYALCLLVVVRLLNRETPAHDLQLYALSLLLVLDAAALNINWIYAPCFLAYTISIVWALTTRELKRAAQDDHVTRHGRGEAPLWRERGLLSGRFFAATAVISIAVLFATLSLFIVFPRVGLGMLRLGGARQSGFAQSVELGTGGSITADPAVVMRVTVVDGQEELPRTLYFRGAAFDRYDGTTWSRSQIPSGPGSFLAARMPRPQAPPRRIRVALEPLGVPFLFAPGQVSRVTVEPSPRILSAPPVPSRDGQGDLRVSLTPDELLAYELETDIRPLEPPATLRVPEPTFPDGLKGYLDTTGLSARAAALARQWTQGATTPWEKVTRLTSELRKFAYTAEDPAPPFGVTPLDHFLFDRHAGHCEYYATALALMSRSLGVPARMVGGYQGGALHPRGGYLVLRQSDAHAWVEIYAPDVGWTQVDAVPLFALARPDLSLMANLTESLQKLWEDYVVDFSLGNQVAVAQGMAAYLQRLRDWRNAPDVNPRQWLQPIMALLVLVGGAWLAWRRRHAWLRRDTPGSRLGRALREAVERVAGHAPGSDTVRQWVRAASLTVTDEDRAVLEQARDAFEQCRYGGMPLDAAEETRLSQAVARIHLPRQPAR